MKTEFHMTVATLDNHWDTLATDVQLIKPALLYADRITLCSTGAVLAQSRDAMLNVDNQKKAEYFLYLTDGLDASEAAQTIIKQIQLYQKICQVQRTLTQQEHMLVSQTEDLLARAWEHVLIPQIADLSKTSGWEQILMAVDAGIVTVHPLSPTPPDKVIREFVQVVEQALTQQTTYPLLDGSTHTMIRKSIEEDRLVVSSVRQKSAKHAALSENLLARLPLFEEATIADILDLRRELRSGLTKFRSAIAEFSEDIQSAAWDTDFPVEADMVFVQKVAPAIQEIEDAARSNPYMWQLIRKTVPDVATGSAIASIAASLSPGSDLVALLTVASAGLLKVGLDVREVWKEKRRSPQIEGNKLYFYYNAIQKMKK